MNRLLAVKLNNQIVKWANSRNLLIGGSLSNAKLFDTDDKVSYCSGIIAIPSLKIELSFDTKSYIRHKVLSVRGWHMKSSEIDSGRYLIPLQDLDDTLDHIVNHISAETHITHDGLEDLSLTGLPDLEHNPILATYLSDVPNKDNDMWGTCRGKVASLLKLQGIDDRMFPNCEYAEKNFAGHELYTLLHHEMCGDSELGHTYYHALIDYHQPLPSETVSGCLTYYQDDRKRQAGIRTPIRIRKYLDKFFRNAFAKDGLCAEKESIIVQATDILTKLEELDVRIHDDDDYDGWADAYASEKISSCMNTTFKNYGVGTYKTFRCYLTSYYTGGEFSSGLSLAVLYNKGIPVARSIVYEQNGQKYFVRVYADNRLTAWLEQQGYIASGHIPAGTHLYTEHLYAENDDSGYICPYVDDNDSGAKARFERIGRYNLWVIDPDGDHSLQVTCGYLDADNSLEKCEYCDEYHVEHEDIPDLEHGGTIALCAECYDTYVHNIDRDWQFYPSVHSDTSLVRCYDGDWYSTAYLSNADLVICDGYLHSRDDCFYCSFSNRWVLKDDDGIYLGDAPQFVQTSWAEYLEEGYVAKSVYDYHGYELSYYSDYEIHNDYAKRIVLGDTITYLAASHIKEYVATKLGDPIAMPYGALADYDKDLYKTLVDQAEQAVTNPSPSIICDHVFG